MVSKKSKESRTKPSAAGSEARLQAVLEQINPEFIRESALRIGHEDVERVYRKAGQIRKKIGRKSMSGCRTEAASMISMVEDYWNGKYRRLPYWSLAVATFGLLYVLKPIDIIPDSLPGIGQLDDVLILSQCVLLVDHDLRSYRLWKLASELDPE